MLLQIIKVGTKITFPGNWRPKAELPPPERAPAHIRRDVGPMQAYGRVEPSERTIGSAPIVLSLESAYRNTTHEIVYVPYVPGAINYFEGGGDVISGMFSGCYMSAYSHNNARRVAHVHTIEGNQGLPNCKEHFSDLLGGANYNSGTHFKPFAEESDIDKFIEISQRAACGINQIKVMGALTVDNRCFSVFLRKETDLEFHVEYLVEKLPVQLN